MLIAKLSAYRDVHPSCPIISLSLFLSLSVNCNLENQIVFYGYREFALANQIRLGE